jgi:hypothetical protein
MAQKSCETPGLPSTRSNTLSNARKYQGSDQPGAATAWLNKLAASAMADEWRRWSTRFTEHEETQTRQVRGDDAFWEQIAHSHADEDAQDRAEARAVRQENAAAESYRRENAKIPDIGAMLTQEQALAGTSSLLSGPGGVAAGRLRLGRPTLLGG